MEEEWSKHLENGERMKDGFAKSSSIFFQTPNIHTFTPHIVK